MAIRRKGHTVLNKRLHGQEERFVERAISMGIGSTSSLSKHTGLPRSEIEYIRDIVHYKARAQGRNLPHNSVERLLMNGELTVSEIAKLCKVTPKYVKNRRYYLKQQGIITRIPGSYYPPVKVARILLRYDVLRKLAGLSKLRCDIKATVMERVDGSVSRFFTRNPNILKDVRTINNGIYWRKAREQLKEWVEEQEQKYGKKYAEE